MFESKVTARISKLVVGFQTRGPRLCLLTHLQDYFLILDYASCFLLSFIFFLFLILREMAIKTVFMVSPIVFLHFSPRQTGTGCCHTSCQCLYPWGYSGEQNQNPRAAFQNTLSLQRFWHSSCCLPSSPSSHTVSLSVPKSTRGTLVSFHKQNQSLLCNLSLDFQRLP